MSFDPVPDFMKFDHIPPKPLAKAAPPRGLIETMAELFCSLPGDGDALLRIEVRKAGKFVSACDFSAHSPDAMAAYVAKAGSNGNQVSIYLGDIRRDTATSREPNFESFTKVFGFAVSKSAIHIAKASLPEGAAAAKFAIASPEGPQVVYFSDCSDSLPLGLLKRMKDEAAGLRKAYEGRCEIDIRIPFPGTRFANGDIISPILAPDL